MQARMQTMTKNLIIFMFMFVHIWRTVAKGVILKLHGAVLLRACVKVFNIIIYE